MTCGVLAAYGMPAVAIWAGAGLVLALAARALPLTGIALVAAAGYGCYYGALEITGRRGLPPPGRSWQVPQTMMIDASPARRIVVWGALLGPGFLTRNPYAGFGALPLLLLAAAQGPGGTVVLAAALGLAHGTARAMALLRDARELRPVPAGLPATAGPAPTHLDLLLKIVYWRRLDGAVLLAAAAAAAVAGAARYT